MDAKVSVRELRQNLSVYLRRVERGEALEVTRRGEPVALLGPLAQRESTVERVARTRGATRPSRRLAEVPPPIKPKAGERPLSEVLQEQREELIGRR